MGGKRTAAANSKRPVERMGERERRETDEGRGHEIIASSVRPSHPSVALSVLLNSMDGEGKGTTDGWPSEERQTALFCVYLSAKIWGKPKFTDKKCTKYTNTVN
ncbi:hypothetical protein niasHS_011131 [Heterodera schachtii]|uniref:Uncharacterized protein n=1 Tax=Heterodera schachtii TaxID=97005 RepID=A0ABD2ITL4_HETSC